MQMTRLEDHPTTVGTLVHWVPSTATQAAVKAAQATTKRGSYMQEAHLGLRKAMIREGSSDASWIGISFDLPANTNPDNIAQALNALSSRHSIFRGWFTDEGDTYPWFELEAEDVSFELEEVGTADTEADVKAFVLDELTRHCTPFDEIGWRMCGVIGEDKIVLYMGQDHIYTDGFSVILLFNELIDLINDVDSLSAMPPTSPFQEFAEIERAAADAATIEHPAVQHWADFALADPAGGTPRFPMDTGIAVGEKTELGPYRLDLLNAEEDAELDAYAKSIGATFPALLHAAFAITTRDLTGKSVQRFLNPVHTRSDPQWWLSMGWFINVVPVLCTVESEDTLESVAVRMRESLRDGINVGELPALRVMEIIQEVFGFDPDSAGRPPIISYLDGRILPGQEKWEPHRFHGLTGAGAHDDVNVWVNRMPDDVYVMCAVPDTPQAMKAVDDYFQYARKLLRGLLAGKAN